MKGAIPFEGLLAICLSAQLLASVAYASEVHPGAEVYQTYCGACHDAPDTTRAPALAALQEMSASALRAALFKGVMQEQAKQVPRREMFQLIDYLAARPSADGKWISSMTCSEDNRAVNLDAAVTFPGVGVDDSSSRYLSAQQAGLVTEDMSRLKLAWAIGFPETNGLRAAPVIIGDTLFYTPDQTGLVLALDAKKPCIRWTYDAGGPLRSSMSHGFVSGMQVLVFGDRAGQVHSVNAKTGEANWVAEGRHSALAMITGSPLVHDNQVIVPVSGSGVGRALNPEYECCAEHGSVVALDATTGKQNWIWHTMREATYTGKTNSKGVKLRGPSGAPIWSSPTIDVKRNLVYVTSGQNTSLPATQTSDAVIAIDLKTGEERWVFQALADDVWNLACRVPYARSGPNCPDEKESVLKDFDFGAAAILAKDAAGKDILLAGQKSGDVWALEPASGKLLWNLKIGEGTPLGGVHWGMARNETRLFVPINDPAFSKKAVPGMYAVDISSGKLLWERPIASDCSNGRKARYEHCESRYGLSAAPLVVDGAVIAGTLDGRLMVYAAVDGEVLFTFDALRDFDTVNGVPAKGGSIESHSIFAGAGMVFVGAGYGQFGEASGNVLLAFKPVKGPTKKMAADE